MSSDVILKAPDGTRYSLDNYGTQKWLDGHEQGALAAVKWLQDLAVKRFADRQDKDALMIRGFADKMAAELLPQLTQRAAEHQKMYPYELEPEKPKKKRTP